MTVASTIRRLSAIAALIAVPATAGAAIAAPAPAYVVTQFTLNDPAAIKPYAERVPALVRRYGGRFLARGGTVMPLEGRAPRPRVIIIRFNSLAAARAWYTSPGYTALRPIRQRAGEADVYIVEGVPD